MRQMHVTALGIVMLILTSCGGNTENTSNAITSSNNNEIMSENKVSAEDLAGIRKALDLYVQAAVEGDSRVARPAFTEGATISHV